MTKSTNGESVSEKRKKPRKPRNFPSDTFTEVIQNTVFVEGGPYHPKQARKLAKWLESAADYLEARKK